jgi:murein DD-endopeptidase MepM/ murein hydrolase activator NlpD
MTRHRTTARGGRLLILAALFGLAVAASGGAAGKPGLVDGQPIVFPLIGDYAYTMNFGDARGQGAHEGIDIEHVPWRTPVVAAESGTVKWWTTSWRAGCMLYLYGKSGTTYMYIHLNNDRTLRNDNRGGCKNGIAFAPGLRSNERVRAGELIAYVGDSGDANGIASHLHFELHPNGNRAVSPYRHTRRAYHHLYARPAVDEVETLQMRVRGTVLETYPALAPQQVRIQVRRVDLSNGWITKPARELTVTLTPETVLRRRVAPETSEPVTLAVFQAGDRVAVWTGEFANTRAAARAWPGTHTIRDILLRPPN